MVLFKFFRGQGKTPEVPDGVGQIVKADDDEHEDETDNEDEKDNKTDVEDEDKNTDEEGKEVDLKSAKSISECKLKSAQHVKGNRKDIVEAGRKVKTLREMKAEQQRKKNEAFYFIDRETRVDNRVHWEELQCGVITDASMEKSGRRVTRKVTQAKNKIESSSSSDEASESEMFPSDDDGKSVDAAAGEAAKILLDNKAFEMELEMEYKNKPAFDLVIDGKCYDPDSETPNFDIIIYELNKMESSEEILQVKSLLVKIQNLLDFESDIDDNPVHNDGSENVLNSDQMQNPVVDDSKDSNPLDSTGMNNVQHVNFPLFHNVGENLQVPGSVSNPAVMSEVQNQLYPSLQVTGNPHVTSDTSGMNQFQYIANPNPVLHNQPVGGSVSNVGFQWNAAGGQFPIGVPNIVQEQHVQQVQPQPQVSKFVITDESGRPSIITLPSDTTFLVQNGPPGSYFLTNMANVELNSLQNKHGITDELKNYCNITNEKDATKTEKTEQDIENEGDKQNHMKSDVGDNKREIELGEKDNDDTILKKDATEEVLKKEPEKVENAEGNGKPSDKKEDLEGDKSKKDSDKCDTGPNNNITIIDAKEGDGSQKQEEKVENPEQSGEPCPLEDKSSKKKETSQNNETLKKKSTSITKTDQELAEKSDTTETDTGARECFINYLGEKTIKLSFLDVMNVKKKDSLPV